MANLSISIPDAMLPRVTEAFKAAYNYQATLPDGTPNPETDTQFVRRQILNYVKELTVAHEAASASSTARDNAAGKTRSDFG